MDDTSKIQKIFDFGFKQNLMKKRTMKQHKTIQQQIENNK